MPGHRKCCRRVTMAVTVPQLLPPAPGQILSLLERECSRNLRTPSLLQEVGLSPVLLLETFGGTLGTWLFPATAFSEPRDDSGCPKPTVSLYWDIPHPSPPEPWQSQGSCLNCRSPWCLPCCETSFSRLGLLRCQPLLKPSPRLPSHGRPCVPTRSQPSFPSSSGSSRCHCGQAPELRPG